MLIRIETIFIQIVLIYAVIHQDIISQGHDRNKHCQTWAYGGECRKNPDYMLVMCQASCDQYLQQNDPFYYSLLQLYRQVAAFYTQIMNAMDTLIKMLKCMDEYEVSTDEKGLFKLIIQNISREALPVPTDTDIQLNNRYGFMVDGIFRGISYYRIRDKNITDRVLDYIKPSLRKLFSVSIMKITCKFIVYNLSRHTI